MSRRDRRVFWVAMAWLCIPVLAAVVSAPRADALFLRPLITTTVVWTGDASCITIWVPVGGDDASPINACSNDQLWTSSYLAPAAGSWVGADPEMSGAETLSCSVRVSGGNSVSDFGIRGDGREVSCLVRWVG